MIAIARLVAQILDDGVERGLLYDATGVATAAAQSRLAATAQSYSRGDHSQLAETNDELYHERARHAGPTSW